MEAAKIALKKEITTHEYNKVNKKTDSYGFLLHKLFNM